ncbi:unnamed protein product, partial [Timema podura]|nr:unnamed protein product [Timema podura]
MEFGPKPCPICHTREVNVGSSQECSECRSLTCPNCGALVSSSDNKRTEWMCNMCMKRTNVSPVSWQSSHQQNQSAVKNISQQQQQGWQYQIGLGSARSPVSMLELDSNRAWDAQMRGKDLRREGEQQLDRDREYPCSRPLANGISQPSSPSGKLSPCTPSTPSPTPSPLSDMLTQDNIIRHPGVGSRGGPLGGMNLDDGREGSECSEDEEDDDEEESEQDEEEEGKEVVESEEEELAPTVAPGISSGPGQTNVTSFYDHSPGEVYTIPEEEEEASSPIGGDGVTSLRQHRLAGDANRQVKMVPLLFSTFFIFTRVFPPWHEFLEMQSGESYL